jgi:endonuclease/exonuclease/phosphatase family metal-dependent hydrolase
LCPIGIRARLFDGLRWILLIASWSLLAAVVTHWILIRFLGDAGWLGTVALFAPRWLLLVPLIGISAMCAVWRRRLLWVCLASAVLIGWSVMGLCVPMSLGHASNTDFGFRMMTVNCGEGAGWDRLNEIVQREQPDAIAFQEVGNNASENRLGTGWYWNHGAGTAIASRYPILSSGKYTANGIDRWGDIGVSAIIELPQGRARICCIHLGTPRWGLEELAITHHGLAGVDELRKNTQKRELESRKIRAWIGESDMPTIVAGDFNMPVESAIYRRYWSDFQNAFTVAGWGYGHSKFTRWHGVRIDHILTDTKWSVARSYVADDDGGDHRPVVADVGIRIRHGLR